MTKVLFRPEGLDQQSNRLIWDGNPTGLIQLNNVKYLWARELYKLMRDNFWIPEKYDLTDDKVSIRELNEHEKKAYTGTLCYLTFLDSIQVSNLPELTALVTAPEVRTALVQHAFQETIHAASYQYIIESLYPADEREGVYHWYRNNPILLKRMQFITKVYEDYLNPDYGNGIIYSDTKDQLLYLKALIANLLLEGLYFYTGFLFFYSLAERGMMLGTSDIIRLINRDELTHVRMFQKLLTEFLGGASFGGTTVRLDEAALASINDLIKVTTENEIEWGTFLYAGLPHFDAPTIEQYCKYRANMLVRSIGLEEPFPEAPKTNPYLQLELISDTDPTKMGLKGNFFEGGVTNYGQSSSVTGWDAI